jgi:hypothetical protein
MSEENNNLSGFFGNIMNNANLSNLIKDEKIMKTIVNFATQMGPQLINCDLFNQILDSNPNITDELITNQINVFKKDHPDCNTIIDKYLQSYQEKRSDKNVYNIRSFLQSGHCKEALGDPQVQQYLNEVLESPKFKDKFEKLLSENMKHLF